MNAVVHTQEIAPPVAEGATLLAVISRAAADPQTDVEKMERLMAMYERIEARRAEAEFASALADMQSELPSISERGGIKDRNGNVQSTYALWEDINEAIKPILQRYGFALSFRTDCVNGVAVTGVLSHKSGHHVTTTLPLPVDTTGSKNAVQAVASSVSYGKRYTAGLLLNFTSHGEDDDAASVAPKPKAEPRGTPKDGMKIDDFPEDRQAVIREHRDVILTHADEGRLDQAHKAWKECNLAQEEKAALWFLLPSHHRSALKRIDQRPA